jgi:hypothetical protein
MLVAGGPTARVREPEHLRTAGAEVAAQMLSRYEQTAGDGDPSGSESQDWRETQETGSANPPSPIRSPDSLV